MTNKLQKFIKKFTSNADTPTVTFNKATIDDINLIRQCLKEEFDSAPELQNPKLLEELIACSYKSKNAISRSHIRKLMESLGEPWISHYNASNQRRIAECDALK